MEYCQCESGVGEGGVEKSGAGAEGYEGMSVEHYADNKSKLCS